MMLMFLWNMHTVPQLQAPRRHLRFQLHFLQLLAPPDLAPLFSLIILSAGAVEATQLFLRASMLAVTSNSISLASHNVILLRFLVRGEGQIEMSDKYYIYSQKS